MSIFIIAYVNDGCSKMEYWIRTSAEEIYEVLSCPTMRWLMGKEFKVIKATIGKNNGEKIYVNHEKYMETYKPNKKLKHEMIKDSKHEERFEEDDIEKLYECYSCKTYYLKRVKCDHCGRKLEKLDI